MSYPYGGGYCSNCGTNTRHLVAQAATSEWPADATDATFVPMLLRTYGELRARVSGCAGSSCRAVPNESSFLTWFDWEGEKALVRTFFDQLESNA